MSMAFQQILEWLVMPVSGSVIHAVSDNIAWHGRLMVLAWGMIMPVGILIARFFKVMPGQNWPHEVGNSFWFIYHRMLGYIAALTTIAASGLLVMTQGYVTPFENVHALTGWLILALVLLIIAGTWLRGSHGGPINPFTREQVPPEKWFGDHFNMTRRRVVFEHTHKYGSYGIVILSLFALFSGLQHADAPRWMWIALVLWFVAVFIAGAILQAKGKCLDTYQAIWGPSGDLPGSHRSPVGIGIRQVKSE